MASPCPPRSLLSPPAITFLLFLFLPTVLTLDSPHMSATDSRSRPPTQLLCAALFMSISVQRGLWVFGFARLAPAEAVGSASLQGSQASPG